MSLAGDRPQVQKFAADAVNQVKNSMYGVDDVIRLCLVALYVKGHVLLEGNPGLGKTSLVNTIADTLDLSFRRIQFTPDLLPSDILVTPKLRQGENGTSFELVRGPVFTSLLLADEINRATQKTQSALLEAMGERQVTMNGETTRLDEGGVPFMVLATQNPIDHEGTYELPEAQLDRFLFKVLMPTPRSDALKLIMRKTAGALSDSDGEVAEVPKATPIEPHADTIKRFTAYHNLIKQVRPAPSVQAHVENLFQASNGQIRSLQLGRQAGAEAQRLAAMLAYGLGPRAATALLISAKAWTLLFSLTNTRLGDQDVLVNPEALAAVALPVLRHRLKLSYSKIEEFRKGGQLSADDSVIDAYAVAFLKACMPPEQEYGRAFTQALDRIASERLY